MAIQEFRQRAKAQHRAAVHLVDLDDLAAEHLRGRRHEREDFVLGHRATGAALRLRSHASTMSQFGTQEIQATTV